MAKFTKDELHGLKTISDAVKTKDAEFDVKHTSDYLWTWDSNDGRIGRQIAHEAYQAAIKAGAKTKEEAIKKAYPIAKSMLEKAYKELQSEVGRKLRAGYNVQLREIEQLKQM